MKNDKINVTKTYLPNINKYKEYVDLIFRSNQLTNNGQLVQELKRSLENYLGVKNIVLVSNGTLALQVAYKLLELKGEVITTPFSFVATTSSLVWEGLQPVFSDIDNKTFNIDPSLIEKKITQKTSAILPVHVFGNACDVEMIDELAHANNLKTIYDAAHAFGVEYKGESVLNQGDVSILSFHATKLFHTIEGGALIIKDDDLYEKAVRMINFGYSNWQIEGIGINCKMNEFQAAMGLCVLDEISMIKKSRETVWNHYNYELNGYVQFQKLNEFSTNNHHYFPVLFKDNQQLTEINDSLNALNIFPRRYFNPSLDGLSYLNEKQYCSTSRDVSDRILCLPIYPGLDEDIQSKIIETIKKHIKK